MGLRHRPPFPAPLSAREVQHTPPKRGTVLPFDVRLRMPLDSMRMPDEMELTRILHAYMQGVQPTLDRFKRYLDEPLQSVCDSARCIEGVRQAQQGYLACIQGAQSALSAHKDRFGLLLEAEETLAALLHAEESMNTVLLSEYTLVPTSSPPTPLPPTISMPAGSLTSVVRKCRSAQLRRFKDRVGCCIFISAGPAARPTWRHLSSDSSPRTNWLEAALDGAAACREEEARRGAGSDDLWTSGALYHVFDNWIALGSTPAEHAPVQVAPGVPSRFDHAPGNDDDLAPTVDPVGDRPMEAGAVDPVPEATRADDPMQSPWEHFLESIAFEGAEAGAGGEAHLGAAGPPAAAAAVPAAGSGARGRAARTDEGDVGSLHALPAGVARGAPEEPTLQQQWQSTVGATRGALARDVLREEPWGEGGQVEQHERMSSPEMQLWEQLTGFEGGAREREGDGDDGL